MDNFTVTYDINGDGVPLSFTLPALDTKEFDKPVAEHIKNHLAKKIAYIKQGRGTFEDAYNKALAQIEKRG